MRFIAPYVINHFSSTYFKVNKSLLHLQKSLTSAFTIHGLLRLSGWAWPVVGFYPLLFHKRLLSGGIWGQKLPGCEGLFAGNFAFFSIEIRDKSLKMRIFRDLTSRKDFLVAQVKKRLDFWGLICLNTAYLNMGEV